MPAGKLGCLGPHPETTHPRVKLSSHMMAKQLPPTPAVVDYASKVRSWPMYMNDKIGDCTCAGIAHSIQAWTAYAKGLVTLPDSAVLRLYEAFGYVPGDLRTDNGAIEQDVLAYVHANGLAGHQILAYAQVDHKNPDEMKTALNLFGSVYVGAQLPQSALLQTDAGQPWTVESGQSIAGGHAFVLQRWDVTAAPMTFVSWGQLQRATIEWWMDYGQEAWVMITPDFFQASGLSGSGVALAELGDEFSIVTGTPNPFRAAVPRKKWYCLGITDKIMTRLEAGRHSR
jgi:hypothetical protein